MQKAPWRTGCMHIAEDRMPLHSLLAGCQPVPFTSTHHVPAHLLELLGDQGWQLVSTPYFCQTIKASETRLHQSAREVLN